MKNRNSLCELPQCYEKSLGYVRMLACKNSRPSILPAWVAGHEQKSTPVFAGYKNACCVKLLNLKFFRDSVLHSKTNYDYMQDIISTDRVHTSWLFVSKDWRRRTSPVSTEVELGSLCSWRDSSPGGFWCQSCCLTWLTMNPLGALLLMFMA